MRSRLGGLGGEGAGGGLVIGKGIWHYADSVFSVPT